MSRMDKYVDDEFENETPEDETVVLSRVNKNQVMYDDVYFNRTKTDIDGVIDSVGIEEKIEEPRSIEIEKYEQKSYSVNEYLEKAHENKSPDDAKRDIDDTAFREQEDEIRKLIASIDEKEMNEDFFKDLKGENEDTLIGGKLKTDEFDDSIYEALKTGKLGSDNTILDRVLGEETVLNIEKEEDEKIDHTFERIMLEDDEFHKKKSKLPLIIFCVLLFTLILVVIIILLVK